jgi:hypothetical protein
VKELVSMELLIFKDDIKWIWKISNGFFNGERNMIWRFLPLVFFTHQILGNLGS